MEKAMAPHSSTLAWKILWTKEPGRLQSMGSWRVGHDWATSLSRIGEGNGNPLQCSCLENPRDGRAWWAAIYEVAQSQTRLKWLSSSSSKEFACQCRRCEFDHWVQKIPQRRKWQPTTVFLPGKSHGQRSLVGYSPWGCKTRLSNWTTPPLLSSFREDYHIHLYILRLREEQSFKS